MNLNRKTALQFYNSKTWIRCKNAYLEKCNHLCERCLAKGIYTPADIVHHKIYLTDENFGNPELMFGFDNLECLCIAHHNDEHGRAKPTRRWKFVDGELITGEINEKQDE